MLKFDAGASYPTHNHPGGEEVFVLEGEVRIGQTQLNAGDYLYTNAVRLAVLVWKNEKAERWFVKMIKIFYDLS